MALINLRPWREEQKAERQKKFVTNVAGAAIFAAVVVLGIGYYFDMQT
ncbi:PilN domain-containing protein [Pontibacterium sp.]